MAEDRCICCGAVIPEGRQVCPKCESMTVEEALKEIVENGIELGAGDYVDVKALKVARKALEKQIAKKPIVRGLGQRYCSVCGCGGANHQYCGRCGQKLDSEV